MLRLTDVTPIRNLKETMKQERGQFTKVDNSEKSEKTKEKLRRGLISWLLTNKKGKSHSGIEI